MTKRLLESWLAEVRQSRIVIQPDEASYVAPLNLPVSSLIEELANDQLEADLLGAYAGLTAADLRACSLFMYLRAINKI